MTDFTQAIDALRRTQASKYTAGVGPLGAVNVPKFMDDRGLVLDGAPVHISDGHGLVYIRGRESWTACLLWQLDGAVLCVNAVDHFTMPTDFQGLFDHRYDMPVSIAIGSDFGNVAAKVFSRHQDGFKSQKAAFKLRSVMRPMLCDRLRTIAVMRNKTRLVRMALNGGPKRLARLYTNLGFAPASDIGNTTVWAKQVDESNQR